MRTSTIVVLVLFALLLAMYGWTAVGWIALAILLVPVLLIVLGSIGVLLLRSRMKRDMRRFMAAFGRAANGPAVASNSTRGPNGHEASPPPRRGPGTVIDVEAKDASSSPADGAGSPDKRR